MNIPLRMSNWRGLWVGSIIIAQKIWDDQPLKTSSFKKILPSVSKHDINQLERKVFQLLAYTTSVKPSMYARVYFELDEIYSILSMNTSCSDRHTRPLSMVRARLLHIAKDQSSLLPTTHPSYPKQLSSSTTPSSCRNQSHRASPVASVKATPPISKTNSTQNSPTMVPAIMTGFLEMKGMSSSSTMHLLRTDAPMLSDCSTVPYDRSKVNCNTRSRMYDRAISTLEDVTRIDSSFFVLS